MGLFDAIFAKGLPKPKDDATIPDVKKKVEGAYKTRQQRLDDAEAEAVGRPPK
jgi:hypothetical protein